MILDNDVFKSVALQQMLLQQMKMKSDKAKDSSQAMDMVKHKKYKSGIDYSLIFIDCNIQNFSG